jgi:FtsH-binding integral membrane protein
MYDPDALASAHSTDFSTSLNRIYNFTYGWMALGLALSGIVAYLVAQAFVAGNVMPSRGLFMGCCIIEILLVLGLSAMIHKLAVPVAALLFSLYAAINGITLSVVFLTFNMATIQSVFFVTAGTFAGVALFGSLTRKNLSGIGRICMMGLWGIILVSFVNIFMKSSGLYAIINYIGVAVFVGLTAWDAQKVRMLAEQQHAMDSSTVRRLGILCALELYLDFINLFLFLLRLLGGKARD